MTLTVIALGLIAFIMYLISVIRFALYVTDNFTLYMFICFIGVFLVPAVVFDVIYYYQ